MGLWDKMSKRNQKLDEKEQPMTDEQIDEVNAEVAAEEEEEAMVISRDPESDEMPLDAEKVARKEADEEEDMMVESDDIPQNPIVTPSQEEAEAQEEASEYEDTIVDSDEEGEKKVKQAEIEVKMSEGVCEEDEKKK